MQVNGGLHRSLLATPLEINEADHDDQERQEKDEAVHRTRLSFLFDIPGEYGQSASNAGRHRRTPPDSRPSG
jgi:hypothetical protein